MGNGFGDLIKTRFGPAWRQIRNHPSQLAIETRLNELGRDIGSYDEVMHPLNGPYSRIVSALFETNPLNKSRGVSWIYDQLVQNNFDPMHMDRDMFTQLGSDMSSFRNNAANALRDITNPPGRFRDPNWDESAFNYDEAEKEYWRLSDLFRDELAKAIKRNQNFSPEALAITPQLPNIQGLWESLRYKRSQPNPVLRRMQRNSIRQQLDPYGIELDFNPTVFNTDNEIEL